MALKPGRPGATVLVVESPQALVEVAAETVVQACLTAGREQGRVLLALSGGSTPAPVYQRLAGAGYDELMPWRTMHVFWGDERCVPPGDPRSNYRMAAETGLLARPLAGVHRLRGEEVPEVAAREYEELLASFADGVRPPGPPPRLDLVLLGIGEDGHTASLFPGTPELQEEEHWVAATSAHGGVRRLTLTLPVLRSARGLLLLVSGRSKAETLRRVLSSEPGLPASRLLSARGKLTVLADRAAASRLDRPEPSTRLSPLG